MKIAETRLWYYLKPYVPKGGWDHFLNVLYWFRSRKFKGDKQQCPICEFKLEHFAENSCPRCNSGSRHRAIWLFLHRKTDLFTRPGIRLLHFAPEHCLHQRIQAHKNIKYLSGDLFSTRAMEKIDMMNIPYPDQSFDVSISLDVLMHVDDDEKAIRELVRIQNPSGWAIHLVSVEKSLEKTIRPRQLAAIDPSADFGHFDYKRNYGRDYPEILAAGGFEVEEVEVDEYSSAEERQRYNIPNDFKIYLSKVKVAEASEVTLEIQKGQAAS